MAIASLVIGIIGLLISFLPFLGAYAIPLTVLALILGALGMRKAQGKGMAIAGLVLGLLGTCISGWWFYAAHRVSAAAADVQLQDLNTK
jgi:hypothetical protein